MGAHEPSNFEPEIFAMTTEELWYHRSVVMPVSCLVDLIVVSDPFYRPQRNVFTPVYDSVHSGVWQTPPGQTHLLGRHPPVYCHCSRRYASGMRYADSMHSCLFNDSSFSRNHCNSITTLQGTGPETGAETRIGFN